MSLSSLLRPALIEQDPETTCAAYIFRPILGMLLATAMFVLDMLAHSIVSTSDILKIRHETLYILALAAGLLSEQAYEVVSLQAEDYLKKMKNKLVSTNKPENGTTDEL